jgi:hypothetical protein
MQRGTLYRDKKSKTWYISFREQGRRIHHKLGKWDCQCAEKSLPCKACQVKAEIVSGKVVESRATVPVTADAYQTLDAFWLVYKHDKTPELNPSTL